jgi:hypothetical protein
MTGLTATGSKCIYRTSPDKQGQYIIDKVSLIHSVAAFAGADNRNTRGAPESAGCPY